MELAQCRLRAHYLENWRGPVKPADEWPWWDVARPWGNWALGPRHTHGPVPRFHPWRRAPSEHVTSRSLHQHLGQLLARQEQALAASEHAQWFATKLSKLDLRLATANWRLGSNALRLLDERYGPGRTNLGLPQPGTYPPAKILRERGEYLRNIRSHIPCQCEICAIRAGGRPPPHVLPSY